MSQTRSWADRLDLAAMTLHNELASTAFCLAHPGTEYLVYLPDGGQVTVDLTVASGSLVVEWFDPHSGKTIGHGAVSGGARRDFTSPFRADVVLYLVRLNPAKGE